MLETVRLKLHPFTESDLDFLCQLQFHPEIEKTNIDGPQTRETVKKHLDNFISHQQKFGYSQMAIFEKISGKFVGRGGITNRVLATEIGEESEIRFAFLPQFWNQGFASELIPQLQNFAFEKLNLKLLAASILESNPKSFHLLKKYGFKFIKNVKPCYGNVDSIQYLRITREEFLNQKS